MIDSMTCEYLEECLFYNEVILPDFAKEGLKKKYCLGTFDDCERKARKDRGEVAPDNLTPDGRRIARRGTF